VLGEIGAADIPQVLVFNKLDRLDDSQRPRCLRDHFELPGGVQTPRVFVSAIDGTGLAELRAIIGEAVAGSDLNATAAPPSSVDSAEEAPASAAPTATARTGTFDPLARP
jgi:GTP-binding protein HflX